MPQSQDPAAVTSSPTAANTLTRAGADTPQNLAGKAQFVAPKGWTIRSDARAIVLGAPDGESQVAIVDGGNGDAAAAVAAAWAAYRPGFAAQPSVQTRPPSNGWDEISLYRYPAPAGEPRSLFARAMRKNAEWTVAINDVADSVAERRGAQLEVIFNSLAPAGYQRESFAGRRAGRLDATRIAALAELIETARREFDIPGVALGIVQDGEILFEGGFGHRAAGRPEMVDADTLFNIASNGKALTTLMLAKQVEAGSFGWNTPVASLWPEFRLGDPETSRNVQVRHLICACTGMPRQDYEWIFEGDGKYATPASIMELLSTARPTSAFGDTYQYSNLMAAAGGFFGGHVDAPGQELGAAYDGAMQKLVFHPLGMAATTPSFDRALAGNHAAGHATDIDGKVQVTSQGINAASISTRPSGNHWSNARDMLKYVRMELAGGLLPDGRRYIREDALLARREPQATEGLNEYYGMGLKIDRQWGVTVIHHGGSAVGYRSDMIWLPDHGVGAVILINSDTGGQLRAAFRRRLLELLFDGEPVAARNLAAAAANWKKSLGGQRDGLALPAEPQASSRLAPGYRNAELGLLEVRREGSSTWFDFGGWSSEMASRQGDDGKIRFVTISPGEEGFEFELADHGLVLRDAQHEYVFSRTR